MENTHNNCKKEKPGNCFLLPKAYHAKVEACNLLSNLKDYPIEKHRFFRFGAWKLLEVPGKPRKVPLATVAGFRGFKLMEINEPQRLFSRFSFNELT